MDKLSCRVHKIKHLELALYFAQISYNVTLMQGKLHRYETSERLISLRMALIYSGALQKRYLGSFVSST